VKAVEDYLAGAKYIFIINKQEVRRHVSNSTSCSGWEYWAASLSRRTAHRYRNNKPLLIDPIGLSERVWQVPQYICMALCRWQLPKCHIIYISALRIFVLFGHQLVVKYAEFVVFQL